MAPPRSNPRGVYVSNIPYEMNEEALTRFMSEAGPVSKTRLAYHADTGRAKGFGFVDFYVETAAAAVRTLSGRPLPPPYNRALTITFQTDASSSPSVTGDDPRTLLVNPPRGREMERGTMATDAITQTLAAVPAGQLEEVLGRMKGLIQSSPQEAHQILSAHPQLAYALFQAMLMMDLVDPAVISRMTTSSVPSAVPPPPPAPSSYPQPAYSSGPPPSSYPAPPPAPAAPAVNPALAALPPDQQNMLAQVLAMTDAQIAVLPEEQRKSVLMLRSQFGPV